MPNLGWLGPTPLFVKAQTYLIDGQNLVGGCPKLVGGSPYLVCGDSNLVSGGSNLVGGGPKLFDGSQQRTKLMYTEPQTLLMEAQSWLVEDLVGRGPLAWVAEA